MMAAFELRRVNIPFIQKSAHASLRQTAPDHYKAQSHVLIHSFRRLA